MPSAMEGDGSDVHSHAGPRGVAIRRLHPSDGQLSSSDSSAHACHLGWVELMPWAAAASPTPRAVDIWIMLVTPAWSARPVFASSAAWFGSCSPQSSVWLMVMLACLLSRHVGTNIRTRVALDSGAPKIEMVSMGVCSFFLV